MSQEFDQNIYEKSKIIFDKIMNEYNCILKVVEQQKKKLKLFQQKYFHP